MMSMADILLPTTVVGSYSVPEWLGRMRTDYHHQRIGRATLREIYEIAIKAAIKDQERAGVDIVSDGELKRDNDIDYFLERMPGVEISRLAKAYYFDYFDAIVRPAGLEPEREPLDLAADYRFTREQTDRPVKFAFTGPFSLAKRPRKEGFRSPADVVLAFAEVLNREARALAAAGATFLQIDEPFLAGYPDEVELAVRGINAVVEGVDATWAVHICYGNRHARPSWEGHYDFLFPAIMEAHVDQLVLEFARKGYDDLELFREYHPPFKLGLGVIDVKTTEIETPVDVAARIERGLHVLGPTDILVNPDCGLRHLPWHVAREKLTAMTAGADLVRARITGTPAPEPIVERVKRKART
jgi:5-methyltetrahydropteroyltriglutamate--homocysteine methyltransferase